MHARWFLTGLLVPLIGGVVAYNLTTRAPAPSGALATIAQAIPEPTITADVLPEPTVVPPLLGDTVEFVVRRNDTMDRIFRQLKLNLADLAIIRGLPGVKESLDRLHPGDTITLTHEEGMLQALSR